MEATARIALEDLFDISDLQSLQDLFSRSTGVASIITRPDGRPVTKASGFTRFCHDLVRSSLAGRERCYKSDAEIGKPRADGPTCMRCLSAGLTDAGAAIIVDGIHIGNWLIGQVRTNPGDADEQELREYAKTIGIDPEEAVKAFRLVPVMDRERFDAIAQYLYTIVSELSQRIWDMKQLSNLIIEREKNFSGLAASENRFRTLVSVVPLPLFVLDRSGNPGIMNESFRTEYLHSADEGSGFSVIAGSIFPDKADRDTFFSCLSLLSREVPNPGLPSIKPRVTAKRKNGSLRTIELEFVQMQDSILVMFHDITDTLLAEQTLLRMNDCIATLGLASDENIKRMVEVCGSLSRADHVIYNQIESGQIRTVATWNYPEGCGVVDSAHGHICTDIMRLGSTSPVHVRGLGSSRYRESDPVVRGSSIKTYCGQVVFRDGKAIGSLCALFKRDVPQDFELERLLSMCATALGSEETRRCARINEEESRRRMHMLNQDLDRRVAERTAHFQLLHKDMQTLTYSVSHDLRAPLKAIDGYVAMLDAQLATAVHTAGPSPEKAQSTQAELPRLTASLRRNVVRMNQCMENMLLFARIGLKELEFKPLDMESLVHQVLAELRDDQASGKVILFTDRILPCAGDQSLIRRVVMTLLKCIIPEGGESAESTVIIGSEKQENMIWYEIKKPGTGMFRDNDRFDSQTPDPECSDEDEGIGIALVKSIVARHGGRVEVCTRKERASLFRFSLPEAGDGLVVLRP